MMNIQWRGEKRRAGNLGARKERHPTVQRQSHRHAFGSGTLSHGTPRYMDKYFQRLRFCAARGGNEYLSALRNCGYAM